MFGTFFNVSHNFFVLVGRVLQIWATQLKSSMLHKPSQKIYTKHLYKVQIVRVLSVGE